MVTPDPKSIVVLPFPKPLKMAVFPVPGAGEALQLAPAQVLSVTPVQVPLAAFEFIAIAEKSRQAIWAIVFFFTGIAG
jgi:hypothetical protein